jgi:hypothetical protein
VRGRSRAGAVAVMAAGCRGVVMGGGRNRCKVEGGRNDVAHLEQAQQQILTADGQHHGASQGRRLGAVAAMLPHLNVHLHTLKITASGGAECTMHAGEEMALTAARILKTVRDAAATSTGENRWVLPYPSTSEALPSSLMARHERPTRISPRAAAGVRHRGACMASPKRSSVDAKTHPIQVVHHSSQQCI